jgi:sulfate-transporting ATPase
MAQYVYTMNRVGKIVPPKRQILKDISLSFFPGAKIGVLGVNGSGKSTLLKIMAGVDKEYEGEALPMPGMTHRLPAAGTQAQQPEQTVRESVEGGLEEVLPPRRAWKRCTSGLCRAGRRLRRAGRGAGPARSRSSPRRHRFGEHQLEIAADALRLPPWDAKIKNLSGGEKRRVALCRLLLSKPDMLLLDEPTNHLDAESVEWLEQFLAALLGHRGRHHPRPLLPGQRGRVDPGTGPRRRHSLQGQLFDLAGAEGSERLEQRAAHRRRPHQGAEEGTGVGAPNPKGRQAKSKARLARFEELSDYEYQKRNETNEIFIPVGERLGHEVIEFESVSKSFGDRMLIDNLSFKVPAGAIVGIIGPNGAGKSTLFKMIAGKEKPDAGNVKIGKTVQMAFVDQHRDELANNKTVWEDVSGGLDLINIGKFQMASRAYCGRFNFNGGDQQKKVGTLSGGERGRLHLAKTLLQGGNVLLLDEPSNDLDVETLRALEDALLEFAGSVMVISHDRWFLDRIATHILAAEDEGKWVFYDGNYQEYEADKRKRLGEEGARPRP